MPELKKLNSSTKDKLIADIKQIIADADALLQTTADQAGEKAADLHSRIQENLKAAQGRLAEFDARLVDKATKATRETLRKASEAVNQAVVAAGEAAQKSEEAVKKAAESGKETTRHAAETAREAAQKAVAATREAANKVLDAMTNWIG
ncbi:MAG: DUF883 family protein [Desulfuromonadaceae bacterium]|jgi:ElaB/YqjD/DUF883 family membrane-anchored ribosome-binding protein|nr:DUF883 family protein [Desulfuromonadaceae bacterium]MDD2849288.1 DUF883 family protein [Desulfuromonadaceae bacterium]MDD4131915.1 DUF883 family protein [Desulfuromonadaceae bacterium]